MISSEGIEIESLEKPVSNCTFAFTEYFIINMVVASKFMESKHSYQRDCDFFQIEIGSKRTSWVRRQVSKNRES